jgi:hypothetical protein
VDRSDRPPRVPREAPKSAEQENAEFMAAKTARLGVDAKCATCFHCYEIRLMPLDRQLSMVCYEQPPQHVLMGDGQGGVAAKHVPRIVGADFFCHRWKTRD